MKKLFFLFLLLVITQNIKAQLEPRPVVFVNLDSIGLFYQHGPSASKAFLTGEYVFMSIMYQSITSKSLECDSINKNYVKQCNKLIEIFNNLGNLVVEERQQKGSKASYVELEAKLREVVDQMAALRNESARAMDKIQQRALEIAHMIAQRLYAIGIIRIDKDKNYFIDPRYDITNAVFEELNKEYLSKH